MSERLLDENTLEDRTPVQTDPVEFELVEQHSGDGVVLRVAGELDVVTARPLADRLAELAKQPLESLVIDLNDTSFIDSSGLHLLLNARRRMTRRGRLFAVICGEGPVRHAIELARLGETLGLVGSRDELSVRGDV
jgi:anti-sigma B factor antagonist